MLPLVSPMVGQCNLISRWKRAHQKQEQLLGGLGNPAAGHRVCRRAAEWAVGKTVGQGWGGVLPPVSAAPGFGHCWSTASLQRHGSLKKTPPSKQPIDFAQKQLSRTLSSPVKALRLVCNAIISSAIAAVQLSEHISKWIAKHSALVHTGAPAVIGTPLLLGHTRNTAAGEQWQNREKISLSLSLSCGISLVLNLITEDFQVSKM